MKAITHKQPVIQIYTVDGRPKGFRLAKKVLSQIADQWGMSAEDVCGMKRTRHYVACRVEIARILRDKLNLSLLEIAHVMNRDHTSILHLLRKQSGSESGSGF